MAEAKKSAKQNTMKKNEPYKFPSYFGSHKSMVILEGDGVEVFSSKKYGDNQVVAIDEVICKDEYGEYKTKRSYLDNKCADPNRCNLQSRGIKIAIATKKEKEDAAL